VRTLTPAAVNAINSGAVGSVQLVHMGFAPTPILLNSSNWRLTWPHNFSRASTATYFDDDGILRTAAVDELRIDHDPATLLPRGALIEGAATNLARQSQALNQGSVWVNPVAVTSSALTYHGVPFWDLAKTTAGGSESKANAIGSVPLNEARTLTIALQADSVATVSVGLLGSTTTWGVNGDTTAALLEGPGTLTQQVGGLWQVSGLSSSAPTLLRITRTYTTAEPCTLLIYPGGSGSTTIGHSILATRVQVEAGTTPTSYTPTTTTTVTRAADLGAAVYQGAAGLGTVSPITDQPGQAGGMQFELSAADIGLLGLALDDADDVQGTPVVLRTALVDLRSYVIVDAPVDWAGTLDTMTVGESADGRAVIRATAESKAMLLTRGTPGYFSDGDQRRIAPNDGAFRHIPNQAGVPVAWPARSFYQR
jgi:hypothetical protein